MKAALGKLPWLWISVVTFIMDRVSKLWFDTNLEMYQQISVIPDIFSWTRLYNKGAAFGFLADESGWQRWFFALIALAVSTVLVVWLKRLKSHETWVAIALALVLGGALGNLYDRILLGHVIDFVLVHWKDQWYYPAFNLADTAICIGAFMLIIDMFKGSKTKGSAAVGENK
ncbi:signal peptidase II [Pseudomonas sp. F1_0610]|uniref:signal peptidase II n=1 Tax=Pseudomonas sp. F1_0610 TaxID=3114284 RepID=UPI0039C0C7A2